MPYQCKLCGFNHTEIERFQFPGQIWSPAEGLVKKPLWRCSNCGSLLEPIFLNEIENKKLESIKNQLKKLPNTERFWGVREINELPNILWEDEELEKLVSGWYNGGNGIVIATNKRIVFIDKGIIYGLRVEDFPYNKITSIEYKTGLVLGKITIYCSGNKAEIDQVENELVRDFCDYIRARITSKREHQSFEKIENKEKELAGTEDFITKLERLLNLKEKGILTEEEFNEQKAKILNMS